MGEVITFLFVAIIAAFILVPILVIGLVLAAIPVVFIFSVGVRLFSR